MKYKEISFKSLGTNILIKIMSENDDEILLACRNIVYHYHKKFSFYDPSADLYKLNQDASSKKVSLDEDLFNIIDIGLKNSLNESKLNIAIGPLVKLWDIRPEKNIIPSNEEIKRAKELSNPRDIILEKGAISFRHPGMALDLGALAKGYIADRLMAFLKERKVKSALINLGGLIASLSYNQEKKSTWKIGIREPFSNRKSQVIQLSLSDLSVVTSGVFERYFVSEGKRYQHILDPQTGFPLESDMLSLSIISPSALRGEIWSSRLFSLPFEKIEEEAAANNFMALAIYEGNVIRYSKDLDEYINWRKK